MEGNRNDSIENFHYYSDRKEFTKYSGNEIIPNRNTKDSPGHTIFSSGLDPCIPNTDLMVRNFENPFQLFGMDIYYNIFIIF